MGDKWVIGDGREIPKFAALADYYDMLHTLYIKFFFSRKTISSREHPLYIDAVKAFNALGKWWVEGNPALGSRPKTVWPRETIEVPCSAMAAMEVLLQETEQINKKLAMSGLRIGIKPGRLNISRLEHEFSRIRNAVGHGVVTGVSVEYAYVRRVAETLLQFIENQKLGRIRL